MLILKISFWQKDCGSNQDFLRASPKLCEYIRTCLNVSELIWTYLNWSKPIRTCWSSGLWYKESLKKKMAGTRESWIGEKEKLSAYKNSLFIMQHFQSNLPQVELEQKNKVKAIKFALFHDSRYREHWNKHCVRPNKMSARKNRSKFEWQQIRKQYF